MNLKIGSFTFWIIAVFVIVVAGIILWFAGMGDVLLGIILGIIIGFAARVLMERRAK